MLDAGRKPQESLAIAYDRVDNIVRKTSDLEARSRAHVGSYQYDVLQPHAVAQAGERTYRYDASGNTVQRGEQSLRWDHDGRLVALSHSDKSIARYAYGVDRERVVKREGENFTFYITPDFEVRNGVATTWVRAGRHRIAKVQEPSFAAEMLPDLAPTSAPDSVINVADAHAGVVTGEPDEVVDMLLVASAMAALIGPHGLATFVHQDHLGSSAVTTDAHSAVLQRTGNYPYGEIRYQSDYLEDYSWAGQERDVAAGLSYHSARYLDTRTGRWLSADPLFLGSPGESLKSPGEFGLYGFGRGNPITLLDPSGLVTVGEWLLDMAGEASDSGNTVATCALGVAYVGWGTFGMEGVSNLADKVAHGEEIGGGDVAYAVVEVATLGKGGGAMGAGAKVLGRFGGRVVPRLASKAIGFAGGTAQSAFTAMRGGGGHAMRKLIKAGLIPDSGSLASRVGAMKKLLSPVLENPSHSFDWKVGATQAKGFIGNAGGRDVFSFVAKEGPYAGQVISSGVVQAGDLALWGLVR